MPAHLSSNEFHGNVIHFLKGNASPLINSGLFCLSQRKVDKILHEATDVGHMHIEKCEIFNNDLS